MNWKQKNTPNPELFIEGTNDHLPSRLVTLSYVGKDEVESVWTYRILGGQLQLLKVPNIEDHNSIEDHTIRAKTLVSAKLHEILTNLLNTY